MLILVTGGSGSGKSAYAEQLVMTQGETRRYYIATMRPWDEECRRKIARHRLMRAAKSFETIECYQDLHLLSVEPDSVILLECMSNLTANEFYREDAPRAEVIARIINGIRHLQKQSKTLIIVTNEVFSDGGGYDSETRAYQQILGSVNQAIAGLAGQVTEVVYGIPVNIRENGGSQIQ